METTEQKQESRLFLKALLSESLQNKPSCPQTPIQKDPQVDALKKIIHELGLKVKTLTQALEEKPQHTPLPVVDLSHDLTEQMQKNSELRTQIDTVLLEKQKLIEEIEHLTRKNSENEKEILCLQKDLDNAHSHAPPNDQTEGFYFNENRELKQKLVHFLNEKRGLEDLCQKLEQEKTSALLRIREYTTRRQNLESELEQVQKNYADVCTRLNKGEETLQSMHSIEKERNDFLGITIDQKNTIEELSLRLAQEEKKCFELLSSYEDAKNLRSTLENLEKEHVLLQNKAIELTEHLDLLEQHLARRVKENAILSEKLDDEKAQNALQVSKIQSFELLIQEKEEELANLAKSFEQEQKLYLEQEQTLKSQFEGLLQKHDSLFQSWQAQAREIQQHKAMQERLKTLEELFDQVEKKLFSSQEQKEAFGENCDK